MIVSETIARIPPGAALAGGVVPGIVGTWAAGSALADRDLDPAMVGMAEVGGGIGVAALGIGTIDLVARVRGPVVDRYVVDGLEQVARSSMELRYGVAGTRMVAGLMGAGLGALAAGGWIAVSAVDRAQA